MAAREDADRRRGQAESLIGFMLGNLRPKLQQVGRLDLLDDVGQEATRYFNTVPAGGMSGEELFRRSQSLYQIGQVRQAEGKYPDAVAAYRESLTIAQQVAQLDPANNEWQLGVAMAHFYLGDALRLQGDQDGAMREFEGYRDVAKGLVDRDPQNERWQLELAYGHSNVAAVLESKADLFGARRELELSQATRTHSRDPNRVMSNASKRLRRDTTGLAWCWRSWANLRPRLNTLSPTSRFASGSLLPTREMSRFGDSCWSLTPSLDGPTTIAVT